MTLAKLAELDALAAKATPVITKRFSSYDSDALKTFHAACAPERIRAMIACILAADAMSVACVSSGHGNRPANWKECPMCKRVDEFDAARAALEATP